MGAHVFQRKQAMFGNGIDDVTLADTVAAADLGIVGQCHDPGFVTVAGITEVMLSEQYRFAEVGDAGVFAHQLEVPGAVDGVAIEHGTLDAVVVNDQFLVGTRGRVLQHHDLVTLGLVEVTGGEQVNTGHLQFGRGD